jgi:hypothetical protein
MLFSDFGFARRVLAGNKPVANFVLVKVAPGYSATAVRDALVKDSPKTTF